MQHFGPRQTGSMLAKRRSVGKPRPVLQSVQLNDFNVLFFLEGRERKGKCCERATWRGTQSPLNAPSPLCDSRFPSPPLPLSLPAYDFFSQSLHFAINIRNCNWQHTREPWANYLASIFGYGSCEKSLTSDKTLDTASAAQGKCAGKIEPKKMSLRLGLGWKREAIKWGGAQK